MKKLFIILSFFSILNYANAQRNNPFGILPNHTPVEAEIKTAEGLGVQYLRTHVILSAYNGTIDGYDDMVRAGFKIILNVNFGEVNQGGTKVPVPFPTDLASYRSKLNSLLDKYHPALLVVENEETNDEYHSGPPQDYINELKMAINVAHAHGIKVTNGALTTKSLVLLVYQDYINRGMTAQANDFANRAIGGNIVSDLPDLSRHAPLKKKEEMGQEFVNAYKSLDLDYVNFHWYEPVMERVAGARKFTQPSNPDNVDLRALEEVVEYLKRTTGKPVITNEIGELNPSPTIVTTMLQKLYDMKLPIVVWYSGDHTEVGKSVSLHDVATGDLKPNGLAFADFIKAHYR